MIRFEHFPVPLVNKTPMPLLLIHGTSDFIYNGNEDLFSVDETIDYWIRKNHCDSIPRVTLLPDFNKKDKSFNSNNRNNRDI